MARSVKNAFALNSFFAGAMNWWVICCVNVGACAAMPTRFSTPREANEPAMVLWYVERGRDIVTMLATAAIRGCAERSAAWIARA